MPDGDVVPLPQLEPRPGQDPDRAESDLAVQGFGGRVGQGDPGERPGKPPMLGHLEQARVEGPAQSAAAMIGVEVDSRLHRPPVGGRSR